MAFMGDTLIEQGMLGLKSRKMRGLHSNNLLAWLTGMRSKTRICENVSQEFG
jgi:hypothetical protein